ncbi:hypothetical protein HID58_043412, partial [Brassica napus]
MLMIRSDKALRFVRPRILETGTLTTSLFHSSDRNLSYIEKLRSGLVDIKKDDAVSLFQSMIRSRPLPTLPKQNSTISCYISASKWNLKGLRMISTLSTLQSIASAGSDINRPNGGNAPNDCTYNSLIRAHLRYGDSAKSATLIEEMKRCGFAADASTIKIIGQKLFGYAYLECLSARDKV